MHVAIIALAALVAVQPPAGEGSESSIINEARAFMAAYGHELAAGESAKVAARYDRRGAYRLGRGKKVLDSYTSLSRYYASAWRAPAAFSWKDLSFEPAGPDAAVVAGQFLWTVAAGETPLTYSYTALLIRQDGELRIRLEDEDSAPQK